MRLGNIDAEALYLSLPVPFQHAGCSFIGWRTERTRYAGEFPAILTDAQARTFWSADEIQAYRDRRLTRFVSRCAATVPFYEERLRTTGIDPREISSIEDLAQLPILTKADAQEHSSRLVSTAAAAPGTRTVHTSGTTGAALRFPVTLRAAQEQWATWWRYRGWHGIQKGTWSALFAGRSIVPLGQGRPPYWRLNYPGRQLLFSGYHMSPSTLPDYVDELRRRKPPWLHGYPSLLAMLAAHLSESRTDLGYSIRWITTGAENLFPHQAALIGRVFGVKPIQHYGMAEGVANISECEVGRMHVDEDYAAVEFVPSAIPGVHRIVGTNFTNAAGPLLRYDTQDLAIITENATCSCGRPGRVVERVDGRQEDYVVLRNGARLGRMDHIFKDMVNIQEAQIHQSRPGEMTIRVVRGNHYTEADEQALLRETAKRVGDEIDVKIDYLGSLPRSPVGKLRFVVSEIEGASIVAPPDAPS